MNNLPWFELFKEQLQGLKEAFELSGSSLSLLAYALETKSLRSDEYLKWAINHYQLPFLQSRFFTETPPTQEMFAKWATHYPWSLECLPVAEWDNCLIVACLQPPQGFPTNPPGIFVLASYEDLRSVWARLDSETQSTPKIPDTPEGIDFSEQLTTVRPREKSPEGFSFEDLNIPSGKNEDLSQESITDDSIDNEVSASEEKLDGLFDGPTQIRLEALPSMESKSIEPETPAPAPETPPPALENSTPTKATPPPPPTEEPTTISSHSFANRIISAVKPTESPLSAGSFLLEKMKKKHGSVLNEKIQTIFEEMKSHFKKSMILTLDADETQMTAFAWDENFNSVQDTTRRFPLKTPSIFNIVASTQKPYHGYISLNEINEKFFEDWNQGQVPDHVTITPIIVDDKIVGMLMGFAEKSAYNKTSLKLAEKLSGDFSKGLVAA